MQRETQTWYLLRFYPAGDMGDCIIHIAVGLPVWIEHRRFIRDTYVFGKALDDLFFPELLR